jgi:hypothetical protein
VTEKAVTTETERNNDNLVSLSKLQTPINHLFWLLAEQHGRLAATAEHGPVRQVVPLEPALQRDGLLGGNEPSLDVP